MLYWWHAHLRRFSLGTCKIIGGWYQSVYAFAGERERGEGRAGLGERCRTCLDLTPFLALALLLSRSDLAGLSLPLSSFPPSTPPVFLLHHHLCASHPLSLSLHTSRRSSQSPIASGGRFCTAMVSPRVVIMTFICGDLGWGVEGLRFKV
jgi:hypothetical protein